MSSLLWRQVVDANHRRKHALLCEDDDASKTAAQAAAAVADEETRLRQNPELFADAAWFDEYYDALSPMFMTRVALDTAQKLEVEELVIHIVTSSPKRSVARSITWSRGMRKSPKVHNVSESESDAIMPRLRQAVLMPDCVAAKWKLFKAYYEEYMTAKLLCDCECHWKLIADLGFSLHKEANNVPEVVMHTMAVQLFMTPAESQKAIRKWIRHVSSIYAEDYEEEDDAQEQVMDGALSIVVAHLFANTQNDCTEWGDEYCLVPVTPTPLSLFDSLMLK